MNVIYLPTILFSVLFSACSAVEKSTAPVNSNGQTNSRLTNKVSKAEQPTQAANSAVNETSTDDAKTNGSVVGKWKDAKAGTVVQFFKEGTVLMDDAASGQRITGKYQQLDENNIKLTLDLPMSRPAIVKYKIYADNLELGNPDGSPGTADFTRLQ